MKKPTPNWAENITRSASISRCQQFRYRLDRTWARAGDPLRTVVFIGLNPSTADHRVDDPTIRRCIDFSQRWGCNALTVVNLFAYRTPHPQQLKHASDPIGPYNTRHIRDAVNAASKVIVCWGRHGGYLQQNDRVTRQLSRQNANGQTTMLFCLAKNSDGSPAHPLYQRADTVPQQWTKCDALTPTF